MEELENKMRNAVDKTQEEIERATAANAPVSKIEELQTELTFNKAALNMTGEKADEVDRQRSKREVF